MTFWVSQIFSSWWKINAGRLSITSCSLVGTLPTALGGLASISKLFWRVVFHLEVPFLSVQVLILTVGLPILLGVFQDQLSLDGNMLLGTIPEQLSNLLQLEKLTLKSNLLTGTMPDGICTNRPPTGALEVLETDCSGSTPEVECSCCTSC